MAISGDIVLLILKNKLEIPGKVATIEYDPNRSAYISLIHYADGDKRYIISPEKLKVGDDVISGENVPLKNANSLPLKNIPAINVHNVELSPGKGGQMARSAGLMRRLWHMITNVL